MKKIYYLFAFVIAAVALSACKPLSKTYDTLGDIPKPVAPATSTTLTLAATDYKLINKGSAAYSLGYFKSTDSAKVQIPLILASKYSTLGNGSTAAVTYAFTPATIKLADSLNADDAYTLINPTDYLLLPGNTFTDFSTAQTITWLPYKFSTVPENTLKVLTYQYFESGKTSNSGVLQTDAYLFMGGIWQKIYRVSNAQYASVGNGVNNWFIAADAPNLVSYLNMFLKADPTISATAKFGQIIYVNYRYLTTYQRVQALTFDGTNWVTTPTMLTLQFAKTNGVWVADNTVNYALTVAEMKSIGTNQPNVASAAAVANLASFGDYNIQGGSTNWTDDQIATSISVFLKTKYTTAAVNQKFVITYVAYNGANVNAVKTFIYDGTNFVYTP